MSDRPAPQTKTRLSDWNQAMERALARGAPEDAATMANIVLQRLPRHLPTYQRLLRITWMLRRWEEGEEWARRLLQADPANPLAWQSLGRAAEQQGRRAQAQAMWQRAFELNPYAPDIRAGLARTSLDMPDALTLDLACLGTLYLRGRRWSAAAQTYRSLVKADPRRIDFQTYLMLALWQARNVEEAYALARHLVTDQPHLILAWTVIDAIGDENDQALAHHPLTSMDPDGAYMAGILGGALEGRSQNVVELYVSAAEAAWTTVYLASTPAV